jgi:hypothetical protein
VGLEKCHAEDLADLGALPRVVVEHSSDERLEVLGIRVRELLELPLPDHGSDLAEDVAGAAANPFAEGRFERTEAVEDAPKGPYVRLRVIGAALPDLGCRIVGVPICVLARPFASRNRAIPKFPSLTVPSFIKKTFAGFRSRCRIRFSCR